MCGVAAWIDWNGIDRSREVEKMTRSIRHRGPDGGGVTYASGVTLGHRRLSIIDLSEHASQPMERGDLSVSFNGEIYNYIELRTELAALGHRFGTDSDTEVLLASYEQWGTDCVTHFNGMWAFAIHDRGSRTVFCSRDRFGEKPLLYSLQDDAIVLASEVKQFHSVGFGRSPDFESLSEFLTFGGLVAIERTYYSGLKRLPPATNMVICLDSRAVRHHQYYRPGEAANTATMSERDLLAELHRRFVNAVRLRLRSDVRVSMLLSGGIDSSLIAATAGPAYREMAGEPLLAITAISSDRRNDESSYARAMAESMGLSWQPVSINVMTTQESWSEATRVIEQPLGSSTHVMQLHAMRRASELGCRVLLDGQGADESWLGYQRYAFAALRVLPWRQRPRFALDSVQTSGIGASGWLANWAYFNSPALARLRAGSRMKPLGFTVDRAWFREKYENRFGRRDETAIKDTQISQLRGGQLGTLLRYADLTSMAVSIEDRLPFLDHELVDIALSMPPSLLFRDGWSKWPLRNELARSAPPSVAWRKRKIGFEAPGDSFDPSDPEIRTLIRSSDVLDALGTDTTELDTVSQSILWRLFAIALWEKEVLLAV